MSQTRGNERVLFSLLSKCEDAHQLWAQEILNALHLVKRKQPGREGRVK